MEINSQINFGTKNEIGNINYLKLCYSIFEHILKHFINIDSREKTYCVCDIRNQNILYSQYDNLD